MEDKKKHGGARMGAGAKPKAEIEKSNTIFLSAIKELKNVNTDEEAKKVFAKDLLSFERGRMFIAEHIFGKPKETIENINYNADLTTEEIEKINKLLDGSY